ncbi:MAG TPA: DEAD/DEAH box helicase, partial [Thermoanaerobaculia bacterium]|nr:DEAD/DEAH box helicase [Thermoanaerobaculia bacterium]
MEDLHRLEFHRSGVGLVAPAGTAAGHAIYIPRQPDTERALRSCTCPVASRQTCHHLLELSAGLKSVEGWLGRRSWDEVFTGSLWFRLAELLADEDAEPWSDLRVEELGNGAGAALSISSPRGGERARWLDGAASRLRLLERLGKAPAEGPFADRAGLIERLARFQLSQQERALERAGMKSRRQTREESFWFRLAYHCARELPGDGFSFRPAVDKRTGTFTFTCHRGGEAVLRFAVPRAAVEPVLRLLRTELPDQEDLAVHPIPLKTLFRVSPATVIEEYDFDVRPVIVTLLRTGERRYTEREDFEKFRYGRLLYVPELEVLAELEEPGKERKFRAPLRLRLKRSQVAAFLDDHQAELAEGTVVLEEPLRNLQVFRAFDRLEIRAEELTGKDLARAGFDPSELDEAEERSWYWLSVHYGLGEARISLADLLRARRDGLPYLEVPDGWIDLSASEIDAMEAVFAGRDSDGDLGHPADGGRYHLGLPELLRLQAAAERPLPIDIRAEGEARELLDRVVQLRPALPYRPPRALTTKLREYQVLGTNWLRFLAENRLGGLLADDMGLGKTHQAMALMASLTEQDGIDGPFLVVAPTTVLPHWRSKLREHAPGLPAVVHHGPQRDLGQSLRQGRVILTSYGVLRNDAQELARVPFALVVLDEIQHLKNRDTVSWRSAAGLRGEVTIGLTGTPIENSLSELKALFDVVLPGYLGSDARFEERYGSGETPEEPAARARIAELRRVISPFILRRTKAAVLDELPEKIEDLRLCALSEDQIGLYREAIEARGAELVGQLREGSGPVPYIHIFALLNLLKQICDHPALALGDLERAGDYASGKWDLFRELLDESLDSGQKVVVFSQYLGMIGLIERHLRELGAPYVTLTGSSRDRGELVDRFNRDPDCRVFVGSLKAGGQGIDLVGGSVVIHYDRWWNAAREDQATDRVHRMGQRRAVQVFKLVTEGTLEEKIHAIIER